MQEQVLADPEINRAFFLEKLYVGSYEERMSYLMSFKGMMDAENRDRWIQKNAMEKGMQEGIEKGIQEGIEKGEYKAKLDMARSLLSLGVDKEKISVATGLPLHELEKIQAEL